MLLNIAQEHRTFLLPFYSRKGSFRNRKAAPSQSEGRFLLPSPPAHHDRHLLLESRMTGVGRPARKGRREGPCPKSSSELPVHYIQVQVVCAAIHHAPAFGSQSRQVAVQNGRTYPAPRRHNYLGGPKAELTLNRKQLGLRQSAEGSFVGNVVFLFVEGVALKTAA